MDILVLYVVRRFPVWKVLEIAERIDMIGPAVGTMQLQRFTALACHRLLSSSSLSFGAPDSLPMICLAIFI